MSLGLLFKLAEQFTAPLVQFDAARCLNARHPQAGCTRCHDICPTAAISWESNRPQFDDAQCIACGACLWECPNGAFDEAHPAEARLVTTVAQQSGAVELVCPVASMEAPHLQEGAVIQTPRCLAALSPAMLIELAEASPTLWLNDSACGACGLARLHTSISQATQAANAWLALYERSGNVRLFTQDQPALAPPAAQPPIIDGNRPHVDRRALLRGQVHRRSVIQAQDQPVDASNPVDARLDYRIPRERVRLLVQERTWPQAPEQTLSPERYGFGAITIDEDRCTLCGWCAGFCPTAALERWHDDDTLQLVFQPLRCLDCNICVAACPIEAVSKLETFPGAYLRRTILLVEDTGQPCTKCGKLTGTRQGDLCVWCRERHAPSADRLDLPWERLFPTADES